MTPWGRLVPASCVEGTVGPCNDTTSVDLTPGILLIVVVIAVAVLAVVVVARRRSH